MAAALVAPVHAGADTPPPSLSDPRPIAPPLPDAGGARAMYEYRSECVTGVSTSADPLRCLELETNVAEAQLNDAESCLRGGLLSDKPSQEKLALVRDVDASGARFIRRRDARCGERLPVGSSYIARRNRLQCRIDLSRQRASEVLSQASVVRDGDTCALK